jgi:hypothetical protein
MSIYCPWGCKAGSRVLDSRVLNDTVRRRRECKACAKRWTTWETEQGAVAKLNQIKAILNVKPNEATQSSGGTEPQFYGPRETGERSDGLYGPLGIWPGGKLG